MNLCRPVEHFLAGLLCAHSKLPKKVGRKVFKAGSKQSFIVKLCCKSALVWAEFGIGFDLLDAAVFFQYQHFSALF